MHRERKAFVRMQFDMKFAMKLLMNITPNRLSEKRLLMSMLEQQAFDLT
jgi:hypothetical protein